VDVLALQEMAFILKKKIHISTTLRQSYMFYYPQSPVSRHGNH